jgi:hypothetical protein
MEWRVGRHSCRQYMYLHSCRQYMYLHRCRQYMYLHSCRQYMYLHSCNHIIWRTLSLSLSHTHTHAGILEGFKKHRGAVSKELKEEQDAAEKVLAWLVEGHDVRLGDWTAREIEILNTWQLLTAKPVVYLVNMSAKDYARKKNKFLPKIAAWVEVRRGVGGWF